MAIPTVDMCVVLSHDVSIQNAAKIRRSTDGNKINGNSRKESDVTYFTGELEQNELFTKVHFSL